MHDIEEPDLLKKVSTYKSFEPAPKDESKPTYRLQVEVARELYTGGTLGISGGGGAFIGYKLAGKLTDRQ
jgi:hypothetical protein